jgi:hypothetical protein
MENLHSEAVEDVIVALLRDNSVRLLSDLAKCLCVFNVALWKEGNCVHVYCLRLILLQEKKKKRLKFRYETFDKAAKQEALFGTALKNKAVGIARPL